MSRIFLPDQTNLALAANALRRGALVSFPTETVYGLGGDATNDRAVAAIYAAKDRPSFNPLIVHVPNLAVAIELGDFNEDAMKLAQKFWPGPLTLVVKRKPTCPLSLLVSAGMDSIALRVPAHPVALALLTASNLPLAGPSANASGRVSPTTAQHVEKEFGVHQLSMILNGGACRIGIESTVLSLFEQTPVLLRPGGVTRDAIVDIIGKDVEIADAITDQTTGLHSPGRLLSHYAPDRPVRINATNAMAGEALLAFGPHPPAAKIMLNLSETSNLEEAAANLFAMLRALDQPDVSCIAVMKIPQQGLGLAINDRLQRAASPR